MTTTGKYVPPYYGKDELALDPPAGEGDPFGRIARSDLVLFRLRNAKRIGSVRELHALLNPESFRESVAPQYARRPVIGLSQEIVQYTRTAAREISMELWVAYGIFIAKGWESDKINPLQYRNFFQSLTVPTGPRRSPPRVEIIWPNASLAFIGVVTQLDITYERFNRSGYPLEYKLALTFLETATQLRVTPKVMAQGLGYNAQTGKTK